MSNQSEPPGEYPQRDFLALLRFGAAQLLVLLRLLALIAGPGALLVLYRRRVHWGACAAACGVLAVGASSLFWLLFMGGGAAARLAIDTRIALLGCGAMGLAALGGFVAGVWGRRVGIWEVYVAAAVVAMGAWLWLSGQVALSDFLAAEDSLRASAFEQAVFIRGAPGAKFLGPMWERLLGLFAFGSVLCGSFGGSLAFMIQADSAGLDLGFGFEWGLSRRLLRGRDSNLSGTALVGIAGIALGVAALVTVNGVMSGYQLDIEEKILSTTAHLVIQKYGVDFAEYQEVGDTISKLPEVVAQTPFVFGEAMLSYRGKNVAALLKGVHTPTADKVTGVAQNLCRTAPRSPRARRLCATEMTPAMVMLIEPGLS